MKIGQVRARELVKALEKLGFRVKRQKGSHLFLEKIIAGRRVVTTVAMHQGNMPMGTLKAILRQTEVSEEELMEVL